MTDETTKEVWATSDWVVTSQNVKMKDGTTSIALAKVANLEEHAYFKLKSHTRGMVVGNVYRIEVSPDGHSFRISDAKYVRRFEDTNQVLAWQAADYAAVETAKAEKLEAKYAGAYTTLRESLAEVRKIYRLSTAPQRAAIEIWVLSALRNDLKSF